MNFSVNNNTTNTIASNNNQQQQQQQLPHHHQQQQQIIKNKNQSSQSNSKLSSKPYNNNSSQQVNSGSQQTTAAAVATATASSSSSAAAPDTFKENYPQQPQFIATNPNYNPAYNTVRNHSQHKLNNNNNNNPAPHNQPGSIINGANSLLLNNNFIADPTFAAQNLNQNQIHTNSNEPGTIIRTDMNTYQNPTHNKGYNNQAPPFRHPQQHYQHPQQQQPNNQNILLQQNQQQLAAQQQIPNPPQQQQIRNQPNPQQQNPAQYAHHHHAQHAHPGAQPNVDAIRSTAPPQQQPINPAQNQFDYPNQSIPPFMNQPNRFMPPNQFNSNYVPYQQAASVYNQGVFQPYYVIYPQDPAALNHQIAPAAQINQNVTPPTQPAFTNVGAKGFYPNVYMQQPPSVPPVQQYIPPVQQPMLTAETAPAEKPIFKRERKPLAIVDPTTKTQIKIEKPQDKEKENEKATPSAAVVSGSTATTTTSASTAAPTANHTAPQAAKPHESTVTGHEQQPPSINTKPAQQPNQMDMQGEVLKNLQKAQPSTVKPAAQSSAPLNSSTNRPNATNNTNTAANAVSNTTTTTMASVIANAGEKQAPVPTPTPTPAPTQTPVQASVPPTESTTRPTATDSSNQPKPLSYSTAVLNNPPQNKNIPRQQPSHPPTNSQLPNATNNITSTSNNRPIQQQQQPQQPPSIPQQSRQVNDNNNNRSKQHSEQGHASLRIKPSGTSNNIDGNKLTISTSEKKDTDKKIAPPSAELPVSASQNTSDKSSHADSDTKKSQSASQPVQTQPPAQQQQPVPQQQQVKTPVSAPQPQQDQKVAPILKETETSQSKPQLQQQETDSQSTSKPAQPSVTTTIAPKANEKVATNISTETVKQPVAPTVKSEQQPTIAQSGETSAAKLQKPFENMWTPENREGKKRYDREFLLSLSQKPISRAYPEALRGVDIGVKDIQQLNRMDSGHHHQPDFKRGASMGQDYSGRGSNNKSRGGKSMKGQNSQNVVIVLDNQLNLKKAENPYLVKQKNELSEDEELLRQVRNVLNKITPQNLQKLAKELIQLPINNEERLKGSIEIIFEKAIDEPVFSQTYSQLCEILAKTKVPTTIDPTKTITFRTMLLTKCQRAFDTDYNKEVNYDELISEAEKCTDEAQKKEMKELAEEKLSKAKRKSLGNIRFIGELFKLKMLTEGIMFDCIERLLKQENDEENLECLCRLLTTIGKELDKPANQTKIKSSFEKLEKITKKKDLVSARTRFMILDVLDLKKDEWVPRRKDANPKTIDEIRKEAEEEQKRREEEILLNAQSADRRTGNVQGGGRGGGMRGSMGGNSTGGKSSSMDNESYRNRTPNNGNMVNKLKDVKNQISQPNGPLTLGPSWNKFSMPQQQKSSLNDPPSSSIPSSSSFSATSGSSFNKNQPNNSNDDDRKFGVNKNKFSQDMTSRLSMDSNKSFKDSQINKVKNMDGSNANLPRSETSSQTSSRETSTSRQSRDNSRTRNLINDTVTPKPVPISANSKNYSEDEIDRKVTLLIEEYIQNKDIDEALRDIDEFRPIDPKQLVQFIELMITKVLEKSEPARQSVGQIFYHALKLKKMDKKLFTEGLKSVMEIAEDMLIDVPKIATYLSHVVTPLVQDDFTIEFLNEACSPIKNQPICGDFLSDLLHNASNKMGHSTVSDIFLRSSGLKLGDFVPNPEEFMDSKKLSWLARTRERTQSACATAETYEKRLLEILKNPNDTNEIIFATIEEEYSDIDVGSRTFVRSLMIAVIESCLNEEGKLDPVRFNKLGPILTKFISHNEELELESLFAVQMLDTRKQHPSGFIRLIFDLLYDEDIIREDIFWRWKDLDKEEGHQICVLSLKGFFEWLREAEDTEDAS